MQVNKDDLINMVRYGAELVFSSDSANITDAGKGLGRGRAIIKQGEPTWTRRCRNVENAVYNH